jgi:hypothetical protein
MAVASVRLNLNGMGIDDVLDLLVTGGFVVVARVGGVIFTLSIVTVTALVLTIVGVVVIVLYAPVKVVVSGSLSINKNNYTFTFNEGYVSI